MIAARWTELLLLYLACPLTLTWAVQRFAYRRAMAPLLWVIAGIAVAVLLQDPSFDRGQLTRLPLSHPYLSVAAIRFCLFAPLLLALGGWLTRDELLRVSGFARRRPHLWVAFALLYTMFSVVPQGILFRVYFLQRFGMLFASRAALLVVGAIIFSLGHVMFRNVPALVITAVGGAFFLDTYVRTHSMLLAAAEHGLYGAVAFTAGLGKFLYLGARRDLGEPRAAEPSVQSNTLPS
jgi:hypothetical protein